MVDRYCNMYNNLEDIPEKYITQEMVSEYWNNSLIKSVYCIPEKFITKEMVDLDWNINKDLISIPEQYITQEMVDEHFGLYRTLKHIPKKYINKSIIDRYRNSLFEYFIFTEINSHKYNEEYYKFLEYIPEEYITKELVELYIAYGEGNLSLIPQNLIPKEYIEIIWNEFKNNNYNFDFTNYIYIHKNDTLLSSNFSAHDYWIHEKRDEIIRNYCNSII